MKLDIKFPWYKSIFCALLITLVNSITAKESLILAIDVVRHGDRTPLISIPKQNYIWQQGLGQLTPLGAQQEFELGTFLKKKYIDKYNLLPKNYQNGTILVFSTAYDRTLLSAQALLLGLYPLKNRPYLIGLSKSEPAKIYLPIPINIKDWPLNNKGDEKKYQQLSAKYIFSRKDAQEKISFLRKRKLQHWSQATGINFEKLEHPFPKLQLLGDALIICKTNNIALPPTLTEEDIKQIIEMGNWWYATTYGTKEIANLISDNLLVKITEYLQKVANDKTTNFTTKYILFSNHDASINSIMTLLGNPLPGPPPYAANLNFLLFKDDNKNHFVKISYNEKPVIIPGCNGETCSLDKFIEIIGKTGVRSGQGV